jgi:hypothetical protein
MNEGSVFWLNQQLIKEMEAKETYRDLAWKLASEVEDLHESLHQYQCCKRHDTHTTPHQECPFR